MNRLNRLKGLTAYLCGPMEHTTDNGASWRERIVYELNYLNIQWLDPRNNPIGLAKTGEDCRYFLLATREAEDYDVLRAYMLEARELDLRSVDVADFLVVHLDTNTPTCGSWEEIVRAYYKNKPILIHYEQGKKAAPLWLFGMFRHEFIFSTWQELYDYLRLIDCGALPAFLCNRVT